MRIAACYLALLLLTWAPPPARAQPAITPWASYQSQSWNQLGFNQAGYDLDGSSAGDNLGIDLVLNQDGTRLAAGAYKGAGGGYVLTYDWDAATSSWGQVGTKLAGEASGDEFGFSVSLSADGDRLAVGGRLGNGTKGYVKVYDWDANGSPPDWVFSEKFLGGGTGNRLGTTVSLSADGSRLAGGERGFAVGAKTRAGRVRVWDWDGSTWGQVGGDVTGSNVVALDNWGGGVLSGDGTHLAGGTWKNANNRGIVDVFTLVGGTWTPKGSAIVGVATGDEFGLDMSLSHDGSRLAVGAALGDDNTTANSGYVQVFDWDGSNWVQAGATIFGAVANAEFGQFLSMSSDGLRLAAGAKNASFGGHARVYDWDAGSSNWVQVGADIDGEAAGDQFGTHVCLSLDGSRLAVGAVANDGGGANAGHVRVFGPGGESKG